ncbi:50S ribosomal protein L13 [Exophiala aquamarina CBS 119918]|uniref:Large ribosomal subunit protein uL13m n=1 Tax=Exophiala aquamarina CBS 119918 TaxID=1182545 RepID=A0A072PV50_9EURO|nr:50S ribosomal protein L13 [Exophiala aquamarina CBS 119918]KEF59435.1 50S ribosomal protein L13 [Exophiala aquamarina CBS 119918]
MSQVVGKTRLAYSRTWHQIDIGSDSRPLGRIASSIAVFLMGKHKPIYDPSTDCGDYVVAVGCHDLHVTGKKRAQKQYYTHTTRPGSLKQMSMDYMIEKWGGGEVLKRAVRGMLPKNRLRDKRLARLKVFEGSAHPYKQNIVKFAGKPYQPGKVMEAIEAEKANPIPAPPPS